MNTLELENRIKDLEGSNALLRAALDATVDGVLAVDAEGKIMHFNDQFLKLWRIPKDIVESRDDAKAIAYVLDQLADPDAFIKKVNDLYADHAAESYDQLRFKDGRTFERFSRPQTVNSAYVGRVWCFRDVTDRIRSEADLVNRNTEMERLFKSLVGREQAMVELKERIKKLEDKQG